MIYVSSSCVKAKYIRESVLKLAEAGFTNIELSGGTQPYESMLDDLLELKEKFSLNYLLHNYFPPPSVPFVVNLAALDTETSQATLNHLKSSLKVSRQLNADKFGFHAGFLINIPMNEMGKSITRQELFDETSSLEAFCIRYEEIKSEAGKIELYLENNVLSATNYENFDRKNPFHFTDLDSYRILAEKIQFKPLIDVGHLKVSCHTLGLDFPKQLAAFQNMSDYIHVSDNDALRDSNQPFVKNSELYDLISRNSLANKTITLEVYSGMNDIIASFQTVEELLK